MARWVGVGTQQPLAGFEPTTSRSQVRHRTTRPPHSASLDMDITLQLSLIAGSEFPTLLSLIHPQDFLRIFGEVAEGEQINFAHNW